MTRVRSKHGGSFLVRDGYTLADPQIRVGKEWVKFKKKRLNDLLDDPDLEVEQKTARSSNAADKALLFKEKKARKDAERKATELSRDLAESQKTIQAAMKEQAELMDQIDVLKSDIEKLRKSRGK